MDLELKRNARNETYVPPRLMAINLRPEEAVLGHCKITGQTGPVSAGCQPIAVCPSQGS
jgi:hypothetical protein